MDRVKNFLPLLHEANQKLVGCNAEDIDIEVTDGSNYVEMDLALGLLEEKEATIEYKAENNQDGIQLDMLLAVMIKSRELAQALVQEIPKSSRRNKRRKRRSKSSIAKKEELALDRPDLQEITKYEELNGKTLPKRMLIQEL